MDNYEAARRSGARIQIEKLVNILNGDDEDKYDQVFGENGHLLSTFLEAAEERKEEEWHCGEAEVLQETEEERK